MALASHPSLEDSFHNAKSSTMLEATFRCVDKESMQQVLKNMLGVRTETVLRRVALSSPSFEGLRAQDVLDGRHGAFRIHVDAGHNAVHVHIDHKYVGGPMFYRFVEALLRAKERPLPTNTLSKGLIFTAIHTLTLFRFHMRVPQHTRGPMMHARKEYTLPRGTLPRRFVAYHAFLQDAFRAFGRDDLVVAFSVVFESERIINNVGVVVVTVRSGMGVQELMDEFRTKATLASATNTLSNIGRFTRHILPMDAISFRRRVDIVCTSMVVEGSLPCHLSIRAAGPVYEGAYVSLFSQLRDDTTAMTAAVSTNSETHDWRSFGFLDIPATKS